MFSLILQTEKAFLKQPKVFLWYVHSKHCKFDFYVLLSVKFTDSSYDFVIFVVILNFAARRRQRRGTGLEREEIAIGRALDWVSRLLARLLRVCHLCFQTTNLFGYCTKFVYFVFTCFYFLFYEPRQICHFVVLLRCADHIYESPLLLLYFSYTFSGAVLVHHALHFFFPFRNQTPFFNLFFLSSTAQ